MIEKKISFFTAILININIVIGGAFFLSSHSVVEKTGVAAPLVWLAVGLLLFPLSAALAHLSSSYPIAAGGLYVYSRTLLGPVWGFISGWGYFIGTAAGNALIVDAFIKAAHKLHLLPSFTWAEQISTTLGSTLATLLVIIFFALLNMSNIELLGNIQTLFTILKTIPFLAVIMGAFTLFRGSHFTTAPLPAFSSLLEGVPLVLFAYIGIEACCALGHLIEGGKNRTGRVLFVSFSIIIAIYTVFQFLLIGIHGASYHDAFTSILGRLTTNTFIVSWGNTVIEYALLSSFLGGFYSMFYANNWNLYALAQEGAVPFSKRLLQRNSFQAPVGCIAAQSLLIILLLFCAKTLDSLMTMSDFGIVCAYILSCCSYMILITHETTTRSFMKRYAVGIAALMSCSYLGFICITNLSTAGPSSLVPYLVLLIGGVIFYLVSQLKRNEHFSI